ncbi:MAG: HlpA protein, partial [Verrucomicrobiales bacterium]|nr:HlpA protein [Verrucomicrobiales bacterium]
VQVTDVKHPRVSFEQADGRALEKTLNPEFLASLPRPWLVIEDADHAYETSVAVLKFFGPLMQEGEYLVVEDGIISDLSKDATYMSGPHKALKEYLPLHPEYEIDGEFCDFFGYNLTWCTNGFLRRKGASGSSVPAETVVDILPLREQIKRGELDTAFAKLNFLKGQKKPTAGVDYLRALYFIRKNQPHGAIESLKEELRYFPENKDALWLLGKLESENPIKSTLGDKEFQDLFKAVRPFTMVGEARLFSLYTLARHVCELDVPGNFVECGVAAGGSSALLAAVISRHSKRPRMLFSCDTFEGMPDATPEDRHDGVHAEATGWGKGTCSASENSLIEAATNLGVQNLIRPVKGLFGDTLPKHRGEMGTIAFLHVDGDWYSSTRDILVNLFDQVQTGGRIQIDDYGYWEGCKKAVTDFAKEHSLNFQFNVIDETGVWVAK